jgi:GT2 family glycosyltransferase
MSLALSVVVPTYNRLATLGRVLSALDAQECGADFEIVVVVDGSTDGTAAWLGRQRPRHSLTVIEQDNAGPAGARNRGIAAAAGRWIALLGDDTIPDRRWAMMHLEAHRRRGNPDDLAVVGHTRWHERLPRTRFMSYINDYGPQFGYALIDDPEDVPFNFFYASNLSLPRLLLEAETFHEGFADAGWEDVELGYRLQQRGLRLVYEPRAEARHDHEVDLRSFARRQERVGNAAGTFYALHPELGDFLALSPDGPPPLPSPLRRAVLERVALLTERWPISTPRLWRRVLADHYLEGLHRGWRGGTAP